MPKSYKVCPVEVFATGAFSSSPHSLRPQMSLAGVERPPVTTLRTAQDSVTLEDFSRYLIEHERPVTQRGRLGDQPFEGFIRMGEIEAYHSAQNDLLLLCGKREDILDFCRVASDCSELSFSTIRIDMKALLDKLDAVRLAWFNYADSTIHASALCGHHIERTSAFMDAKAQGDISTLSFYFEDHGGCAHPVQVTSDGAVVLQANYKERSTELELVMSLKRSLLDGIFQCVASHRPRRKAATVNP